MLVVLGQGGLGSGGLNFDAKVRRESFEPNDLFYAHIGGMDAFARAAISAEKILEKSSLKDFVKDRYASFDSGKGKEFEEGKLTLEDLRAFALANGEPKQISGKQEWLENLVNHFL